MVKTIFIGSGKFGIPTLKYLYENDYFDLQAVITQPDKPAGRNQELQPSEIKKWILDNNLSINLEQPEKIKLDSDAILSKYKPELIIVASYGQIIPQTILDYPKYGCFNLHGSILPDLRGAVPVQMAILKGYKETGVTLQKMVFKMDAGPIAGIKKIDIDSEDNSDTLMGKLGEVAFELFKELTNDILNTQISYVNQDESKATFCYKDDLSKENAEITFDSEITLVERMVRAYYPWPVVWLTLPNGKRLKIYKAEIYNRNANDKLEIKRVENSLLLKLKTGTLRLETLQLEGKSIGKFNDYFYLAS